MSDKVIVSFANERGNYMQNLARLQASLSLFRGDIMFIGFVGEDSIGAPKHVDNPYAFKLYAIRQALREGYKKILYLDSACFAIKDIQPAFDIIEKEGYLMQEAGHYVRDWCNEETKKAYQLTEEELNTFLMYGNAGMLGLNFTTDIAKTFFFQWWLGMEKGYFKGDWSNHRHDMTVGSIIANRLGMKFIKGDQILQYGTYDTPVNNDSIIFKASGL